MTQAEAAANDCSGGSTGPFRRVWSVMGYSWMSADIYLPSAAHSEIGYGPAGGEAAYVYSGGWGANGEAADAGFQHNSRTDNWSLFIKYQSSGMEFDVTDPRFDSGQVVNFTFFVPADGVLRAVATGTTLDGTRQTLTLDYSDPDNVSGWSAAGDGQILKRMTSIAQTQEDFGSGTFLHNVQWRNAQIGTPTGAKIPWFSAQTGGQCLHPSAAAAPGVITVDFLDQANEIDHISL